METHSSILAWRIPWTEEPGRLQSIGSQRVGHNWSDLAHTQGRTLVDEFNQYPVKPAILCVWICSVGIVDFFIDVINSWCFAGWRSSSIIVNNTGFGAKLPVFKFWSPFFLDMWPWTRYLAYPRLSFLRCKMRIIPDPGMEPASCLLHWQAGSLPLVPPGNPTA